VITIVSQRTVPLPSRPTLPPPLFLVLNAVKSSIVAASFTKITQPLIQYKFVHGENNFGVITEFSKYDAANVILKASWSSFIYRLALLVQRRVMNMLFNEIH
jgi:hypothetical protein